MKRLPDSIEILPRLCPSFAGVLFSFPQGIEGRKREVWRKPNQRRLLTFAAYFWPHKGGHERYVYEVCKRLRAKGWKIDIVTSLLPGTKTQEIVEGLTVYRVPIWHMLGQTYPVPKPGPMKKLLERLAKNKYDAVNTHTRFFVSSLWGLRFARKHSIPLLHVEHGTCHPKGFPLLYPLILLYDHTFGYWVFRQSTVVAGVSKAAESFVKHICTRKTVLLPNCIDANFFKPVKVHKPKETVIAFVGRLIAAKGVQDLFAATQGMENVKVVIVGSGNYEPKLRAMAGKNVVFLGERDAFEIRKILSMADIFVNPSYAEGLPTSVLEAGAIGLPVIATDVGGTREIIDDGVNGFLIQPRDIDGLREKILLLLSKKGLHQQFGKRLQEKVRKEFDWKVCVEKFEGVLNKL